MIWWWLACAAPADDSAAGACDRTPPLTWTSFGHGFMERHCAPCHSSLVAPEQREEAPEDVNFDGYEDVLDLAVRIEARAATEDGGMPPSGGPTAEERAMLGEWLDCAVASDRALRSAE